MVHAVATSKKQHGKKRKKLSEVNIGGIPKKDILYFTKNLSVMLEAGSTLLEAIGVMGRISKGRLKEVLIEVHAQVERGVKFSVALRRYEKYFSSIYINMIEVGEESGQLAENLQHLAEQLEKTHELKRKIFSAALYPSVVFIGGIMLSFGIAIFVLPEVAKLFNNFSVELPLPTRILLAFAGFFESHGVEAALATFVGISFFAWFFRRPFVKPITHWIFLHIPVIKDISRHLNIALFCRTMGSLLASGITIDESIRICARSVPNVRYQQFLYGAYTQIKGGGNLANLLATKKELFPLTDIQIISIGERSGALSESLSYCSTHHEQELDSITKNMATILEPILLVLIGVMVAFLALSIITPIYSITSSIRI